MDSFLLRYPQLIQEAITVANYEITEQTNIRDEAAKKVQRLRAIDSTSPYTCIGSDAGQAEIAYNIEEAWLKHEVEKLELIKEWADKYLRYIQSHTDTYDFTSFQKFSDFYTAVNKNHVQRLIRGQRFDCKCQFYGVSNNTNNQEHFYTEGEECCVLDTPVHLTNIKTCIKTIGVIQHTEASQLNLYSIPNEHID